MSRGRVAGRTGAAAQSRAAPPVSDPASTQAFTIITSVVAPLFLIIALLTYFGWIRTGAIYGYFGIDQAVLNLSIQDYLIRSGGVIFKSAAIAGLFATAAFAADALVTRVSKSPTKVYLKATQWALSTVGIVLFIAGSWSAVEIQKPFEIAPLFGAGFLAASAALIAISIKHWTAESTSKLGPAILVLVTLLLATFWATSIYASESGTAVAAQIDKNPNLRPSVTVLSDKPLDFGMEGATETSYRPKGTTNARRYRYDGLRLFSYANERWILIDRNCSHAHLHLQILQDSDSFSVVVSPN